MTVIPFPEPAESRGPVDPLESALLSAWNNAPEVLDDFQDPEPEDTDSEWSW
ncbi:hypothetical protein ACFY3E_13640 [Streptomyces griseorubiginosus]|uniref:hypothetical protein n=1 Tax=Streptomyces griseorubiginosus TaxID=67304 RepID=UPI0036A82FC9